MFAEAGVAEQIGSVWEQVAAFEPKDPHWYLRQIGIDPALQRGGHGSVLLNAALTEIDGRREIAYLEATSVEGCRFYSRHGFIVLGEVRVADSAPLWPMLREPR